MPSSKKPDEINPLKPRHRPFRRAVWRGLAILMPPLLTIVIFLWVGSTIERYVLSPVRSGVRDVIAWSIADVRPEAEVSQTSGFKKKPNDPGVFFIEGEEYRKLAAGNVVYFPEYVHETVIEAGPVEPLPTSPAAYYRRYVEIRYLQPWVVIPVFTIVFVVAMYLLGRFLAAGIGRVLWNMIERLIHQLPLVRNVYSSVKQVTDFVFSENEIEYTRVVAIEYPRKGIWSIGLATGDGMLDIRSAANEPVVSILIPSSPMPVTGYTITVPRSETVDLNITIDQAFQFIVSCGVVVPPEQIAAQYAGSAAGLSGNGDDLAASEAALSGPTSAARPVPGKP